jgi:hypothetical protein
MVNALAADRNELYVPGVGGGLYVPGVGGGLYVPGVGGGLKP